MKKWWKNWFGKNNDRWPDLHGDDLTEEIWQAHRDWQIARQKFHCTLDPDQIDYAIYIIEAAEKRYEMLLRQAKERERSRAAERAELAKANQSGHAAKG